MKTAVKTEYMTRQALDSLIQTEADWCVSLFLPTHRRGPEVQQAPLRLKNLLQLAEERLTRRQLRRTEARTHLAPLWELQQDAAFWQHQAEGLAVFLSPRGLQLYALPLHIHELLSVDGHFYIKPLLPLLSTHSDFYILALSQHGARLLQANRYGVETLDIQSLSAQMQDYLAQKTGREVQLQSHSVGRDALFHGHGGSADKEHSALLQAFRRLDEGLQPLLRQRPLLLASVAYLQPIYREASTYAQLTEASLTGSPEQLSAQLLQQRAWALLEPLFIRQRQQALAQACQLYGQGSERALTSIDRIFAAAEQGRIESLFMAEAAMQSEPLYADIRLDRQLDQAAAWTLLHHGQIVSAEASLLPEDSSILAILRY